MNILNAVKRTALRAMTVVCLVGASLGMVGVAHADNVDVQISSFTDNPDPAPRGGTITYTTVLKNGGPAVATGVVVTWPVPANFLSTMVSVVAAAVTMAQRQARSPAAIPRCRWMTLLRLLGKPLRW